jgi:phospholipid transport system transporter-binding protein
MSSLKIVNESPDHYVVHGDLTFSAMDKKTLSSFTFLNARKQITLDLGMVDNADSAGLALLLEWIKLVNLAKLSGLDKKGYFASELSNQADQN